MSVISCVQIGTGRGGSADVKFNRKYKVVFLVRTNNTRDGTGTVGSYTSLPRRFAPYVGYELTFADPFALCTGIPDVQPFGDDMKTWHVTCSFETNVSSDKDNHQDPTDAPPLRWIEVEQATVGITKDFQGKDITNSAGQLLGGLTVSQEHMSLVFSRNEPELDYSKLYSYNNVLNSDVFYGFAPHHLLMQITAGQQQIQNGVSFYPILYRAKVAHRSGNSPTVGTWDIEPADRGTAVLDPAASAANKKKLHPPIDSLGHEISGEVYLDGHGKQITDPLNTPIVYLPKVQVYPEAPFSVLKLGG